MRPEKLEDKEFTDCTITEVGGGFFSTAWGSLAFDLLDLIKPEVGMTARFYSKNKGLGSVIRGLDINGIEIYYRTEEEENKRQAEMIASKQIELKAKFEKNKEQLDKQYEALPEVFKKRIQKFRFNNPDFRWKYEDYELFCCEEAVKIASHFKTTEEVEKFSKMEFEQQKEFVADSHSGNTFGMALRLAYLYVSKPEDVIKMHGALAPVVGSEEYGCMPKEEK